MVGTTPPDQEREREQAFQNWLAAAETAYLECRVGKHIIPGITDERTDKKVIRGVCITEAACVRCGVVLRKQIGVKDGYLQDGGRGNYDYSQANGYLLPKEATGPGGSAMDRAHRGMVRLEVLDRAFHAQGSSLHQEVDKDRRRGRRRLSGAAARSVARAAARKKSLAPWQA